MYKSSRSFIYIIITYFLCFASSAFATSIINTQTAQQKNTIEKGSIKILDMKKFSQNRAMMRQCFMAGKTSCNGKDITSYYTSSNPKQYWSNLGNSFASKLQPSSFNRYGRQNYSQQSNAYATLQPTQAYPDNSSGQKSNAQQQNDTSGSSGNILIGLGSNNNQGAGSDDNSSHGFVIG